MGSANIAAQKLLDALDRARMVEPDVIPPGWMTAKEIAKIKKCHPARVVGLLSRIPNVKKKKFRINNGQRISSVVHYSV